MNIADALWNRGYGSWTEQPATLHLWTIVWLDSKRMNSRRTNQNALYVAYSFWTDLKGQHIGTSFILIKSRHILTQKWLLK